MVLCKVCSFTIPASAPIGEVLATFRLLEKRGAFITHVYKDIWRANIPQKLDVEPFRQTLLEDDCVDWLGANLRDTYVPVPDEKELWIHRSALPSK